MQNVITYEQAKKITKGRTPLVPLEYEEAVKSLAACVGLDDAKTWSDKADALAAWAKIYHDDKITRQAKELKLHAYRRMGELAREIQPRKSTFRKGTTPGPQALLEESGLTKSQAGAAIGLAKLTDGRFNELLASPKVPAPTIAVRSLSENRIWLEISSAMSIMRLRIGKNEPGKVAQMVKDREKCRETCIAITDWLDEFERRL